VTHSANMKSETTSQTDEPLRSQVVKRSPAHLAPELQATRELLDQRTAELAIVDSVERALAAKSSLQEIYDAVGDKIREIFDQADVEIRICDERTGMIDVPYVYELGRRISVPSNRFVPDKGVSGHVLRTRKTLLINENAEQVMRSIGSWVIEGTQMAKSSVFVPLVARDRALGLIGLSDMRREHAYEDSDVRLLETLANSLSVALENAPCSTRRSACSRRRSSATPSWQSSTACRRRSPPSWTSRGSTTR